MSELFVGLMSGTSLDGADAALIDFSAGFPRTLAFATVPFSVELRDRILTLSEPGRDGLELSGTVSLELADLYARAVEGVIAGGGVDRKSVVAIGCHGQTVRHRPDLGFTIQLNDPARLAELTGIDVIADFRRRDMRPVSREKNVSTGLSFTTMSPLPGLMKTRATAFLRRPVP